MRANSSSTILRTVLLVLTLLVPVAGIAATTTVNLTAQRMSTTLADGTSVPMWGYCTTGACAPAWAPGPTIVIANDPAGNTLNINLTNALPQPTSIVILGQLGGGLGVPTRMSSPTHAPQNYTTFPGNALAATPFTPPAQAARVKSFATEVAAAGSIQLTWNNLKPGTYLYETGTLPSLQAPMGLYGTLIVTQAAVPAGSTAFVPGKAYPGSANEVVYDTDTALLFSEIDPVQNRAVDAAAMDGADVNKRFNDPTCSPNGKCYPAAVNYTPTYFLINGKAFDKTVPQNSAFPLPGRTYASGHVLLRLLNAGLRTHVPSVVGLSWSLLAEDGNVLPGNPKVQSEVLLTAGKTHDLLITPAAGSGSDLGNYAPATYTVFDRQLSLSGGNLPDAGMQGFLTLNSSSVNAVAGKGAVPAAVTPTAVADIFDVPLNSSINGDVRANDIAVTNAAVVTPNDPGKGSLLFNPDGTFTYTAANGFVGIDSFSYNGNGGATNTVTVTLKVAALGIGGAPTANPDSYVSNLASSFTISRPGVLANDSDPGGYPLSAQLAAQGTCSAVTLNADGSFSATGSGTSCQFTYLVRNSQGTSSATATVTVAFGANSSKTGLNVAVVDAKTNAPITDYRWIIQEDLTFKHDTSKTPSLSTRTLGTSFHKSYMGVVASGCVGAVSCGAGQQSRGMPLTQGQATTPDQAELDPVKNYYISILPGDAANPVGGCANSAGSTVCPEDGSGHAMSGAEINGKRALLNGEPVTVRLQQTPLVPAQLSVYIYEDNGPTNGQNDLNENGLGGFNIVLFDPAGRVGDVAGQQSYDAFNMPLSNALLGSPGCPDTQNTRTNGTASSAAGNLVGVIYTCPNAPDRGPAPVRANYGSQAAFQAALTAYQQRQAQDAIDYALAGHALIKNLTPARYDVVAHPAAARQGAGEVWWQTETLEGTPAQDAFVGVNEPRYFQEFGPPGFHTTIGFVNPDHVRQYATANGLLGNRSITGKITNQRMSRPSDVRLWDAGSYDLLSSTTCRVALNSQGGNGPAVATAQCDKDGNFTLSGIPSGSYEVAVFDEWLDQIIQTVAVSVGTSDVAMGNIPVLSWFTQYDQNIFMDNNNNGIYDAGEPGISNLLMTSRYRNGAIHMQTATDSNGNGLLAEMFPLFNWYVVEADTTRFKQTGVNVIVDGGGPADSSGPGAGLWSSKYATGDSSNRVEQPGAYSYGLQSFISQRNTINWGRAPYGSGENGGIQGLVVYSSTRPFDDQRFNVQTIWEPLVPRVTVNLYRKEKLADGTETLKLVDTTQTSSWDDWVNAVDANGIQVNMQCPGQRADDPFVKYTLAQQSSTGTTDIGRCYDGFHSWNQAQAAPYDGRYNFPSKAYIAAHPLTAAQGAAGQTLVSLPPGNYVVEAVTPPGYEIVKEEDKNILIGDAFVAPAVQQFGALGSIFILPDQATLNNANPNNPSTGDPGFQSNPTSNLGVTNAQVVFPDCVGNPHRVPDFLSLYPSAQQVAPFAGMDRPLCDRKAVALTDQAQSSANFFVFTQVPVASNNTGIILDDASAEFNAASPDFGEKASVPFVPVSIKDFNGLEISRTYSDQWGAYNLMTPSSWLVNPPTPSGYGPNMLISCMNDPGPIAERNASGVLTGRMVTDPAYNPAYSNFCYTNPYMPGLTTYLDTPVLPIAAFAAGYNPADCAYPDATPAIARVDSSAGFGPYLPSAGGSITITALGDQQVLNPGYAGPFADANNPPGNPAAQRMITRHYGFGSAPGTVMIGKVTLAVTGWSDSSITATVPAGTPSGELSIAAANGKTSVDTVTVTLENAAPRRVQGANGDTIQAAIEAAAPGELILVDAGTYNELLIMWKPVRLQGVGASSVIINAAKYPNAKLDGWRNRINALFSIDGTTGNVIGRAQVDPLPTQEITGGIVLLEPSVLGTEEGAGITVLAKNLPFGDCQDSALSTINAQVTDSNFRCAASRIDGLSVTGGDAGGGIYVNGWAHNLEIANNRVYGNAGALHGGVRVGVPYLELESLPTNGNGNVAVSFGDIAGFGYDLNVSIHHNAITKNGTVEGPAGNGGAGGGLSMCTGSDGYSVDHNWICGNISSADGGGIGHLGYSQGGRITGNTILFNQSFQQSNSTHGGGIAVVGEPPVAGALSLGTGNLSIDGNLIRGNFAEAGHGGGIRLQGVNGADVAAFPQSKERWFAVTMSNNMIVNNVSGWGGGGVSLVDALVSTVDNNSIVANDSVGIAGVVLAGGLALPAATPAAAGRGKPSPAGISSETTSPALRNASRRVDAISNPELINNVVWKNRSFFYSGDGRLCVGNSLADAQSASCAVLPDQASTGQEVSGAKYWDLGILGDASPLPGVSKLNPRYSVLTSINGYGGGSSVQTAAISHVAVALRLATVTAASHGFTVGQAVTVAGVSDGRYNGTFTILAVLSPNTFTYRDTNFPSFFTNSINSTGSASVTTASTSNTGNTENDPQLADIYFNGSRVTPEYANVINPPSVKNLQVAATVDEGNNYVSLRYGPLYLSKPGGAAFGDYHIKSGATSATSSAVDHGLTIASNNHDFDGEARPFGIAYDIGADELTPVSLSPLSLVFGSVQSGSVSPLQTVSLTNKQTTALAISSISIAGNFQRPSGAAGGTCSNSLAAGASCTINIAFAPTSTGSKSGTLTVVNALATQTVSLSGTGVAPSASRSPSSLVFGNVPLGTTSPGQAVTLSNTGFGPLNIGTISFSGANGGDFAQTNNCASSLAVGASCTVTVSLTPGGAGSRSATLNLNDGAGTQTVAVSGTGTSSGASINVAPNPLTFGNSFFAVTRPLSLTNTGSVVESISSVTLSNNGGGRYAIAGGGTCGGSLVVGATCTINVRLSAGGGSPVGNLRIVDSAGTQNVVLQR
jgi:hypothetical protein